MQKEFAIFDKLNSFGHSSKCQITVGTNSVGRLEFESE